MQDLASAENVQPEFDLITCLSTIEHVGLGRYGDPLDPWGDLKLAENVRRLLRPGGVLLLSFPQGRGCVVFNKHQDGDGARRPPCSAIFGLSSGSSTAGRSPGPAGVGRSSGRQLLHPPDLPAREGDVGARPRRRGSRPRPDRPRRSRDPVPHDGATLPEAVQSIRREAEAVEPSWSTARPSHDDRGRRRAGARGRADHPPQPWRVVAGGHDRVCGDARAPLMRFDRMTFRAGRPRRPRERAGARAGRGRRLGDMQTFGLTSFRVPAAPALDPWLATYVNCLPGSGCLYRRTAVAAAGGWRLGSGYEDWDLWLTLAELGYPGVYVPRIVFRYRRDDGGLLMSAVGSTAAHYGELRRLHGDLFALRPSRARSAARRP
jgi:hypothetical protein